ncbi:hypothetical protein VTH06DRAFT_7780 [Thermothelomyces fergusii]
MTLKHKECFRVVWVNYTSKQFKLEDYVDDTAITKAQECIQTQKCREFFDSIYESDKDYKEDSMFLTVLIEFDMIYSLDEMTDIYPPKVSVTPEPGAHSLPNSRVVYLWDIATSRWLVTGSTTRLSTS